jgi:hypothetical protein
MPLDRPIRGKYRDTERTRRDDDTSQKTDDGTGKGKLPERIRRFIAFNQRRPGIIIRKNRPSARSTTRGGGTRSVRAPAAAAGIPVTE